MKYKYNSRFSAHPVLRTLGLIVLIILPIIGFWLGIQYQETVGTQSQNTNLSTNWETFSNNQFGFSIKYPSNYFRFRDLDSERMGNLSVFTSTNRKIGSFLGPDEVWLDAGVSQGVKGTLNQFVDSAFPKTGVISLKNSVIVDGFNAYKIYYTIPKDGVMVLNNTYVYEMVLLKNNNIYIVHLTSFNQKILENDRALFDQIISTFKFTN